MPRPSRCRSRAVLALLAASLGLAACSSGGTTAAGSSPAAAVSAAPRPGAASTSPGTGPSPSVSVSPAPGPGELPRGGRELLPAYRLVAYYGSGNGKELGVLGQTSPEEAAKAVEAQAAKFETPDRKILPAFELITTTAQGQPGADGDYSVGVKFETVQKYLDVARANRMYLILDFQPGRSRFLPQVQAYEQFLKQPDVGVALDAEWRMGPGEIPGKKIGKVQASEVNEVSAYVEKVTKDNNLPQKLFMVHQFTKFMIVNRDQLEPRPDLAMMIHVDGFGDRSLKLTKYAQLHGTPPFFTGFKLFYKNDTNIFSPSEVLSTLDPKPDLITYQ